MPKYKFTGDGRVEQDLFWNLNGDGGKSQMRFCMVALAAITGVIACVFVLNGAYVLYLLPMGMMLIVAWVALIHSYRNAIVVEHSPEALRIERHGEKYEVPYCDVYRITEKWRYLRRWTVFGDGLASCRRIKVELKTQHPFGNTFTFLTKREYSDAEELSCVTRLLLQYADKAAAKG